MISTNRFDIMGIVQFRVQWEGCVAHITEWERERENRSEEMGFIGELQGKYYYENLDVY